ncbi:TPA: hypothetical protein N0F65_003963 [Lagenidium giganteum]|uniref:Cytochrome P450 n=1 Tax=Lagenidium giganteum TaxID=4803 RepID=A0AAV2YUF0_9STRA|nr:TPA: hypothetical protein N0F65_003963 [Lagenidium giganteum]
MLDVTSLSVAHVITACACVLASLVLVVPLRSLQRKLRIARGLAPLSGPKGVFLLGNIPLFIKNKTRIYDLLAELMEQYGGRMKMPWHLFFDGGIYISDPADVEHILATNVNNYIKPNGLLDAYREIFEHSFFAMNHAHTPDNGASWKLQRKVAAKVFTTRNFKVYAEQLFHKVALTMVDDLEKQGNQCDMQELSAMYALESVFVIAFGIDMRTVVDPKVFGDKMDEVSAHCASRLLVRQYYKVLGWAMPSEYKLKRNTAEIRAIADKILQDRLAESEEQLADRYDILSLFIKKARELDEDHASLLTPEALRSIILTFIFAGRDTTAATITHTFYMLARHPEIQERIASELDELDTTAFSYDDMKNLRYLDAVVQESIRLYPALPYNVKHAVEDDHLPDGTFIPAGADIVYSPWYMGRHGALWGKDPLVFRPERWLEMTTRPTAFQLPAFQAGPRICIGMNMAILETKMFTAVMIKHFRVRIQDGDDVERKHLLKSNLYMKGGLPLTMTPVAKRA